MSLPKANKSLGQHFLQDQKIIEAICKDFKVKAQAIVEIGPGPGILTASLVKHDLPYHLIEKDERFPEILEQWVSKENIHLQDALKCDYQNFCEEHFRDNNDVWLVSNLPYNVGSVIFVRALQAPSFKYMTLMFQREVADKVVGFDSRKGKSMNSLMALSENYFEAKLLCQVPPGAFSPPPKVDSSVISLIRREEPVVPLSDFKAYETFLRALFSQKRKQLGKVLSSIIPKETIAECLENLGLDRTIRAESLELEQVQKLYLAAKDIRNGR